MQKIITLSVILFFNCLVVFSQHNDDRFSNIQTEFFIGKPIEHDKKLDNAIQGNSFGVLVSWNKLNNKTTKFNNLFNYPERGYTFIYQDFNSTVLGKSFGVYRHYTYNLTPKNNNPLKLTTGFGLGYVTEKYDVINNNQNFAIGSHLDATAFVKLNYFQFLLYNKIKINTGVSLLHFSNVSLKNPNLGINTVSVHLGLNYTIGEVKTIPLENATPAALTTHKPLKYNAILRTGYNESLIENSGLYPFYVASLYTSKEINKYSTLTAGLDFFASKFLKNHIKYINSTENKNYNENKYQRGGVFVGHELTQNNFAFISQIGYTYYSEYNYVSKIYERFGFKYKLADHIFSEVSMKVNLFRAEALEVGIGYSF